MLRHAKSPIARALHFTKKVLKEELVKGMLSDGQGLVKKLMKMGAQKYDHCFEWH